jgi:hypothetical protein
MTPRHHNSLSFFRVISLGLLGSALAVSACKSDPVADDSAEDDSEASGGRKGSGGSKPDASTGGKATSSGGQRNVGGAPPQGGAGGEGGDPSMAGSPAASGGSPSASPVYVAQSLVFGDTGSTSYVSLLSSLNEQPDVSLEQAREFSGYAPADVHEGRLIVGSGESPEVTVFDIEADHTWTLHKKLSFANYTSASIAANISIAPPKVYSPVETVDFLIWDPIQGKIGNVIAAHDDLLPKVGDLKVIKGYPSELRDGLLFQPYYFSDDSYNNYAELSQIAVVDTAADESVAVLDAPCPHLHVSARDDDGNLYFSNGQGSIPAAVLSGEHPKNCFVKIRSGQETLEPDVVYFSDIAEGREGSNLYYIGGDLALFNVYHAELDAITEETEASDIAYSPNYHVWTYNLKTGASAPMEDIGYTGGQVVAYRIDNKTYLTVPAADYSETDVYEISPQGKPNLRFTIEGWGFKLLKLR